MSEWRKEGNADVQAILLLICLALGVLELIYRF